MNPTHSILRLWLAVMAMAIGLASGAQAAPFADFVMDARSGKEIHSQNADQRLHPASLTKMMTLYMTFTAIERGRVRLDTKFLVSTNAANQPPSKLGLKAGQRIELRYLIRAAAVKSANDAAMVLAEGLAGSEAAFAQQSTSMAAALGMRNTQFLNPHGLTRQGHYSTARDMTILGRRLFYDFPQYYSIFSRRSADAGVRTVSSTNRKFLNAYEGADGIKTGYTRAAGFNLTASAQRGSKRIIATVMGGDSTAKRNQIMAQLLDFGFGKAPRNSRVAKPAAPKYLPPKPVVRKAALARSAPVRVQPIVLDRSIPPAPASLVRRNSLVPATPIAAAQTGVKATLRSSARPISKPGSPQRADALTAAMSAAVQPADGGDSSLTLTSCPRPTPAPRGGRQAAATPGAITAPVISTANEEAPAPQQPASLFASAGPLASSTGPAPRREQVILAALSDSHIAPEPVRIVARDRRAGGGGSGVHLNYMTNRRKAEQLMLQTAIRESELLKGARRGVADTSRGWQVRFGGIDSASARSLCDRLVARSVGCSVVGG